MPAQTRAAVHRTAARLFDVRRAGRWLGDHDNAGAPRQLVIRLDDLPVGLVDGAGLKYIEPDHPGTPRAVIYPVPDVTVWRWDLQSDASVPPRRRPDGPGTMRRICGPRGRGMMLLGSG